MAQLNVPIPDWLDKDVSEAAVKLKGKSGWKQHLVSAALIEFLKLPEAEQRQKVLAVQDLSVAEATLREKMRNEAEPPAEEKRRGRTGK